MSKVEYKVVKNYIESNMAKTLFCKNTILGCNIGKWVGVGKLLFSSSLETVTVFSILGMG